MVVARTQTLVQLSDEMLDRLDRYRARDGRSRSEVIREAVDRYLAADREAEIDRKIVDGYTRAPQTDDDDLAAIADWSGRRAISEEPW
jgi:predicted DNA-binding protein